MGNGVYTPIPIFAKSEKLSKYPDPHLQLLLEHRLLCTEQPELLSPNPLLYQEMPVQHGRVDVGIQP